MPAPACWSGPIRANLDVIYSRSASPLDIQVHQVGNRRHRLTNAVLLSTLFLWGVAVGSPAHASTHMLTTAFKRKSASGAKPTPTSQSSNQANNLETDETGENNKPNSLQTDITEKTSTPETPADAQRGLPADQSGKAQSPLMIPALGKIDGNKEKTSVSPSTTTQNQEDESSSAKSSTATSTPETRTEVALPADTTPLTEKTDSDGQAAESSSQAPPKQPESKTSAH